VAEFISISICRVTAAIRPRSAEVLRQTAEGVAVLDRLRLPAVVVPAVQLVADELRPVQPADHLPRGPDLPFVGLELVNEGWNDWFVARSAWRNRL